MEKSPVVKLSNGLRVANMSSPHPFRFTDGTELVGCSAERAKALMLESREIEVPNPNGWTDIQLEFEMNSAVRDALAELEQDKTIDIVLVPFPVMQALRKANMPVGKMRVIRIADRVAKTVEIGKFCL